MPKNLNETNYFGNQEMNFWFTKFKDGFKKTVIPYDFFSNVNEKCLKTNGFILDKELSSSLLKMANGSDFKISVILISVLNILIKNITRHEEVIIGTSILKQDESVEFLNDTLFLKQEVKSSMSFKEVLFSVMDEFRSSEQHQNVFMHVLIQNLNLQQGVNESNPFTDIYFILDNLQERNDKFEDEYNLIFDFSLTNDIIEGKIKYNEYLYSTDTIKQLAKFYVNILSNSIENINTQNENIKLFTEQDIDLFYKPLNDTFCRKKTKTVVDRFVETAKNIPDKVVIKDEKRSMTYAEFDKSTNAFANWILNSDIKPGEVVGILMDRSCEFLISVLGILKAGCIFLPIDPNYPDDRIHYMIEDSQCNGIITNNVHNGRLKNYCRTKLNISNINLDNDTDINYCVLDNPAYIIFTSGSTGKPKGIIISNSSLINYINWGEETYCGAERSNFPLFTSVSFDLTITSIFLPLLSGNIVFIYQSSDVGENLSHIFNNKMIDVVKLTPSHLKMVLHMDTHNSSVSRLILGGEQLSMQLATQVSDKFEKNIRIYNEYGPTETTVGSIYHKFDEHSDLGVNVPIGKPINNTEIFIKNSANKIILGKMTGEIHIGGDGLALGYLNKVEETHKKFYLENGKRFYKTGDIANFTKGIIKYAGRQDRQIKIRGNRVELDDIENTIKHTFNLKDVLVIDKSLNNNITLIAYILTDSNINKEDLKQKLKSKLPEYMIPSHFIGLEEFPITKNGKLDISNFPLPLLVQDDLMDPRNDKEEIMCEIWSSILEIKKISINDNFIQLGGDSIKGIQIIAKLKKEDIHLSYSDLMKYQTIAKISENSELIQYSRTDVTGENRFSPIQKWFFSENDVVRNDYTQYFILETKGKFDGNMIKKTLDFLVKNHTMLRASFNISKQEFLVERDNCEKLYDLYTEKIPGRNKKNEITQIIKKYNSKFNIEEGRLLKVVLINANGKEFLLFLIHHLIIDTVSWQILITDFAEYYNHIMQSRDNYNWIKSDSYQSWVNHQYNIATEFDIIKSLDFWDKICSNTLKKSDNTILSKKTNIKNIQYDFEIFTKDKFERGNQIFNINVQDQLLAAIYKSLAKLLNKSDICFSLEHNGRVFKNSDLDLSRTVGWFTSLFPILVNIPDNDIGMVLKEIKEIVRRIPNNGTSYGIIKYLTPNNNKKNRDLECNTDVSFNYLGEINQQGISGTDFFVSDINDELELYNTTANRDKLEITARIESNKLKVGITYDEGYYSDSVINGLSQSFKEELLKIIEYCSAKQNVEYTPSDYSDSELSIEDLDEIQKMLN